MGAALAPLPRGRHRLPPAAVAQSHRIRIVRAAAEVMMRKGYAETSVADVVSAARISRAVFYEHFASKQQALLEAQQTCTTAILHACDRAFATEEPWPRRIWNALHGVLDLVASNPALSHVYMVECYEAGCEAVRHAEETPRFLTPYLQEGYGHRPAAARLPALCSEAITGAIVQIVRDEVALGATTTLPQRLPELAYIALAPFMGPASAARAIEHLAANEPR